MVTTHLSKKALWGTSKAVLLSIRDYVTLAAPEHEVLRVIGQKSERNGVGTLTSRQIDRIIKTSRSRRTKRTGVPAPPGR